MPCEGCHTQFTFFKRKRSCYDCKRYYCQNCLANENNGKHVLCERCLLFRKRPLVRSDLVKLKPKDLILYLQSKKICTAGCVEKEELINLVLQYANKTDNNQTPLGGSSSGSGGSSQQTTPQHDGYGAEGARRSTDYGPNTNNSFDSIKQTCQNFFSNISGTISDSLANLENRACSKSRPDATTTTAHITEQPRITTRKIPTYASSQTNLSKPLNKSPGRERRSSVDQTYFRENLVVSLPPPKDDYKITCSNNIYEECNCSDDEEIIASFNHRLRSQKTHQDPQNLPFSKNEHDLVNTIIINCASSACANTSKSLQCSKSENQINNEESSHSSFEELGAIGGISDELGAISGISDDSKTTTSTASNITDHWQILDLKNNEAETFVNLNAQQIQDTCKSTTTFDDSIYSKDKTENVKTTNHLSPTSKDKTKNVENINHSTPQSSHTEDKTENMEITNRLSLTSKDKTINIEKNNYSAPTSSQNFSAPRVKKVTRRRSESYLNRRRPQISVDDDKDDVISALPRKEETPTQTGVCKKSAKHSCMRCGKNKASIRQQVEKMRKHLESSQMTETDIKQELADFLVYLEQRTKSIEYSDSEAGISTASATNEIDDGTEMIHGRHIGEEADGDIASRGIRAINICENLSKVTSTSLYEKDSRFFNLDEIESVKQLEGLTVKQLKEILMLHRVDYKGCCEKQELQDRVERLWKNLKSTPAVEKLPTDELCKICMDAPIECVILECGHMATCTNCGKVLSECPICRQYIVRVVRFFRA